MSDAPSPELIRLIMDLRRQGVTDARVLNAIETTPRGFFMEPPQFGDVYADRAAPIGYGQSMSRPFIVGLMTHALKLGDRMKILEIGTGSGYQTAILARLALRVYSVERLKPLMRQAEKRFADLRLSNIVTRHGDGGLGWPEQGPFDRILVNCAAEELPENLIGQLKPGGVMVCPVGSPDADQVLLRITRHDSGKEVENLGFVAFAPMAQGVARDV